MMLCFANVGKAQRRGQALIDSYLSILPSVTKDTMKARYFTILSALYHNINPDKGISFGNKGLELYKRDHMMIGMAKAYNALGQNYNSKNDYPMGMDYYLKSLKIYEDQSDTLGMATVMGNIGIIYQSQNQYDKALKYDSLALRYYEHLEDKKGQARLYGNIGVIYDLQEQYGDALAYYEKAIDIDEQIGDKVDIAKNLTNMSSLFYARKDYVKALEYNFTATKINEEIGDKTSLIINYVNMGSYFLEMSHDDKLKISTHDVIATTKQQKLDKAVDYLMRSIKISEEIGYLEGLKAARETLYEVYEVQGNYKQALSNFKEMTNIIQKINDTSTKVKIANLETQREKEIKDKQIQIEQLKRANARNERVILIAGIILLLIAIGVVLRSLYNQLNSNKQLAKEKMKHLERIKAQSTVLMDIAYVQSHEVRGPLSTIMGLASLFNYDDLSDPNNKELMEGISTVSHRLDKVITEMVIKENNLSKQTEAEMEGEE
jgi:tetratricopeptide (TPR) repeat protein